MASSCATGNGLLTNRSLLKSPSHHRSKRRTLAFTSIRASTESMSSSVVEKLGIKVERNPPEPKLTELGVRKWPKYVSLVFLFCSWFWVFLLCCSFVATRLLWALWLEFVCGCLNLCFFFLLGPYHFVGVIDSPDARRCSNVNSCWQVIKWVFFGSKSSGCGIGLTALEANSLKTVFT